jgi:hypothetical protein
MRKRNFCQLVIAYSSVALFIVCLCSFAPARAGAPVYVTLWFDTEDYVSPKPDQAILRLCQILQKHGVRATFKLIAEKARDLERKGQFDVIRALKNHDLGFHTQTHSQPPLIPQYLEYAGWEGGIEEFDARERGGVEDLKRIFGTQPLCYGQPGNSWAPQTYPVLVRWGIPLYLDEGDHVGINNQPFWYGGVLNVFKMGPNLTRMNLDGGEKALQEGKQAFDQIYDRLTKQSGGLISIYYHPNEWDHLEFWDAVNFLHGANPPPQSWVTPKKKSREATEESFLYFDRYVGYMKNKPGVRFVGAQEIVSLYPDPARNMRFRRDIIVELARSVQSEITFRNAQDVYLSSSEIFSMLLNFYLNSGKGELVLPSYTVYGPAEMVNSSELGPVSRYAFDKACRELNAIVTQTHRIPNAVWVGSLAVGPADFLATLGKQIENPQDPIPLLRGKFTASAYVADDSAKLFDWVILPQGFHAPRIMELAKLQAWTLKPAVLAKDWKAEGGRR